MKYIIIIKGTMRTALKVRQIVSTRDYFGPQ